MRKRILCIGVLLIFQAHSQLNVWTGFNVSKKWSKHFQSTIGAEYRSEIGNGFSKTFLNTQQIFPITKGLEPFLSYRFSLIPTSNASISPLGEATLHRFGCGLKINFIDLLDIGNGRMNISWTIQQQFETSAVKRSVSMLRNRIQWKYDVKNSIFTPVFSAEHFYRWNKDLVYTLTDVMIIPGTVQFRYFVGTEIELNNKQSFQIIYGLRQKYDSGFLNGIIRLSYSKSL
jgi:hypothetical protein